MGKGEKQFAAISKAGRRLAGSIGAPISPAHFSFMAAGKTVSSHRSAFYYDVDGHLLDDLGSNSPLLQKATLSVGGRGDHHHPRFIFCKDNSPSQAGISLYVWLSDAVLPDGRAIRSCTLGRRDAYATARDDAGAGAGSFISLNQGGKGGQPVMKRMHPAYVLTQLPRFFWLLILPLVRRMIEWQETGFVKKLPLLIAVVLIFAAAFLRWKTQRWAIQGKTLLLSNGLLFRRQLRIPLTLIAAVRESRGPMLRLFGAQRIQIETAAARKAAQGMTLYLGKQDTKALLTAYAGKNSFQPVSHMRMRDTLLAALSTSNFALGLFAAAPVLRGAGNLFGKLVQERLWGVLTSAQRLAAAYVPPLLTAIALLALLG